MLLFGDIYITTIYNILIHPSHHIRLFEISNYKGRMLNARVFSIYDVYTTRTSILCRKGY